MAKYTVTYQRDESGAWIARVRGVREAHSYGRTIEQARSRVREALSLWRSNAETAQLIDDVRLPTKASGLISAVITAKKRADDEQLRAQRATQNAAKALTSTWHLSLRDAGELLGISRQRVQQIRVASQRKRSRSRQLAAKARA